jgi:hypothetical protein
VHHEDAATHIGPLIASGTGYGLRTSPRRLRRPLSGVVFDTQSLTIEVVSHNIDGRIRLVPRREQKQAFLDAFGPRAAGLLSIAAATPPPVSCL